MAIGEGLEQVIGAVPANIAPLEGLVGLRRAVAESLVGIVEAPEHRVVLASFVRTSEYLSQFPWCAESSRDARDMSGLSASMDGMLAYYPNDGGFPDIDPGMSEREAGQIVDGARLDLIAASAEVARRSCISLELFKLALQDKGVNSETADASTLTPHLVRALGGYANRREILNSSDPW